MRRREFITLVGGAAATWPFAARAQQPAKTIGFLGANSPALQSQWTAAFVQRLRELGWIEGRTIAIEYRWAEGRFDRSPALVAELVQRKVDVIVTHATANVVAAMQVTSLIPIVFTTVADPVGNKLVASLARPGGNVTGLSNQVPDLVGKRQCRRQQRRGGAGRGSGRRPHPGPRCRRSRSPARRGYCTRHRGAPGSR